jgi:hypothetical protein
MSELDRAAQFAPFAALSGFEYEIKEEMRVTENRRELDESEIERLNEKLCILARICDSAEAEIIYFENDMKKKGGAYVRKKGRIKAIDTYLGRIIFSDAASIPINSVVDIEIL